MRRSKPFYKKSHKAWYVQLNGRQICLGTDKEEAFTEYHRIMAGELPVTTKTTVVEIVTQFLDWVKSNRAAATHQFYEKYLAKSPKTAIATAWRAAADAAERVAKAASSGGGTPTNQAFGGMMHLAGGGFAPCGVDTIPAMLSPGEFVMNARSSRMFYSQLVAMNAGQTPAYRESGGTVNNYSIGDVNVNSSGSTSQGTLRDIGRGLRRDIRRGLLEL